MKKYQCYKVVDAFKIDRIVDNGPEKGLFPKRPTGSVFVYVSAEWFDKHNPEVGGYYVRYKDGYDSYSPAEAFENGYTEMTSDTAKQAMDEGAQQRLQAEYCELSVKLGRLSRYMTTGLFHALQEGEKRLLEEQRQKMTDYSNVLLKRLELYQTI